MKMSTVDFSRLCVQRNIYGFYKFLFPIRVEIDTQWVSCPPQWFKLVCCLPQESSKPFRVWLQVYLTVSIYVQLSTFHFLSNSSGNLLNFYTVHSNNNIQSSSRRTCGMSSTQRSILLVTIPMFTSCQALLNASVFWGSWEGIPGFNLLGFSST